MQKHGGLKVLERISCTPWFVSCKEIVCYLSPGQKGAMVGQGKRTAEGQHYLPSAQKACKEVHAARGCLGKYEREGGMERGREDFKSLKGI